MIATTCKYEELSHLASVAFRDAAIADRPVYQHWVVDCFEEFMTALSTWEDHENPCELFKKWAEDVLRVEVETGSGLYWELRTWERSATRPNEFVATLRCACKQDRVSVNRQNSSANPRASEKRRSIQRFRCQGELHVTLDTATALCSVTCIHLEDHDRPSWRENKFPLAALEFLDKVAEAGMRTADVYRLLRLQHHIDPENITRAQVNYWVAEIESWRYGVGKPDQMKSLKDFIDRPENTAKAMPSVTQPRGCRKGLLYDWMCKLREKGLRPAFFITDKDACQIKAAQRAIPEMHVQLCLKHCLNAIERRMVALDRGTNPYEPSAANTVFPFIDATWGPSVGDIVTGSICPPEYRESVKIFVAQHFNMHPLIPDLSGTKRQAAELHELAVYEAYMFCHERGLHRFWAYLWNEWLVYLLAKKVVGDVEISLKQFQKGREFPTWWVKFRKRWVDLAERDPSDRGYYVTDVSAWSCSCPAFVSAKYLVCKHLVLGYKEQVLTEVPVFLQTYRRFEPPFYVFQSEEEFFSRQTMRPESDPWYNHPPFAEHGLPEDPANDLPEDHGVGNFDVNEAEDPANGLPEGHGVGLFDLNEAAEEIIGDDNVAPQVHAEPNVAAIARHLAEVNVGGDDKSGEEEQADPDRHAYEVMVRVLQQTFDDARLYALGSTLPR
ncbi:hypothetical protein R1sor_012180 [Riccia sorocarpa]|uniref:SWIM-type domain-containing protein n=1 Tax=Riccia sorocarpa TaxID=122646 RepID=A0ABD3I987_9MARC